MIIALAADRLLLIVNTGEWPKDLKDNEIFVLEDYARDRNVRIIHHSVLLQLLGGKEKDNDYWDKIIRYNLALDVSALEDEADIVRRGVLNDTLAFYHPSLMKYLS